MPSDRIIVVDARASIDEVAERVWKAFEGAFAIAELTGAERTAEARQS
jgi:hypothetical protein